MSGERAPSAAAPRYRHTVAALAAGQILCWAAMYYAFSSFVLPMQRSLGWSKPALMGAFTVGLAMWGAASYAVGAAIDRGQGRAVLTWGALLGGTGLVMWSRVTTLPMLYLTWAVLGSAMAMTLYEPAFSVLAKRFPDRYVHGITAITLVGGFASTLSFPSSVWLIAALGWRDALLAMGAVLIAVVAPLHAWSLRGAPAPAAHARAHDERADRTLHEALREPAFWLLTISMTFYALVAAAVWAHVMPAFAAKGHSEAAAAAVLLWFGPAQVLGRLLHLVFGRGLTPRALGIAVMAGLPVSLAVFALAKTLPALLLFAVLFGFVNGLLTIVRGSIVPDYFGRRHVGRISGAMAGIALLARAVAPLATAWLLLALPSYRDTLLVLSGAGVLAFVAFAAARPPAERSS